MRVCITRGGREEGGGMEAALAVLLLYRTEMPMPDVLVSMPISSFVVVPEK